MEQKIASYQHRGNRFQLVCITNKNYPSGPKKYQIRINRKIMETLYNEYQARKMFTMEIQNDMLQLKICDNSNKPQPMKTNEQIKQIAAKYLVEEFEPTGIITEDRLKCFIAGALSTQNN